MAEVIAKGTQVPSTGSCKKSKSLAGTWKHGLWQRSKEFYPVALPRYKRDKVQGELRTSSNFSSAFSSKVIVVRQISATPAALRCPQGVKLNPEGHPVEV